MLEPPRTESPPTSAHPVHVVHPIHQFTARSACSSTRPAPAQSASRPRPSRLGPPDVESSTLSIAPATFASSRLPGLFTKRKQGAKRRTPHPSLLESEKSHREIGGIDQDEVEDRSGICGGHNWLPDRWHQIRRRFYDEISSGCPIKRYLYATC